MIGIRSAISIRARGQWPLLEAVYMTAPRFICSNTKKPLAERGPPYMTVPFIRYRSHGTFRSRFILEAGVKNRLAVSY
jgi:hypothetical protein